MVWVCGREISDNEYPWGIDPAKLHEHGEPQDEAVDEPCNCVPVEISEDEFDRRRKAIFDELQIDY